VVELTTDQKGGIAELAIALEATLLGIGVYRPVTEGSRYDLIFDLGSELLRVQCKWARLRKGAVVVPCQSCRRTRHGLTARTYTAEEIDAIAAYCHPLKKCYLLPISMVAHKREVSLRALPAKNNQRKGLNSAFEYELGAIAQLGERVTGSHEVAGSSPASSTTKAAHNGRLFS
jgi:PD-(D/E)XK nuclease superfamily protein